MEMHLPSGAGADRHAATGAPSEADLRALGSDFRRVYPVNEEACFDRLLDAIDEADRAAVRG